MPQSHQSHAQVCALIRYKFLLALSVSIQLSTAWIITTRMTSSTRSRLMLELLSRSFCWYRHTSMEWFNFPMRSLIMRCSSIKGFKASCKFELELCFEGFSEKMVLVGGPPHPALLVSLSWDRCFLFSISLRLFWRRLILETRSFGGLSASRTETMLWVRIMGVLCLVLVQTV